MRYALLAHPRAQRELDELPAIVATGLKAVLGELATRPRDPKFDLKKMKGIDGEPPALRLRLGEYRVILRIDHKAREILIVRAGHKTSIYRGVPDLDD